MESFMPTLIESEVREIALQLIDEDGIHGRLLAGLVSDHLSMTCRIQTLSELSHTSSQQLSSLQVWIINCAEYSVDIILQLLNELKLSSQKLRIALFNVLPNSPFEDLIAWPHVMGMFYADCSADQLLKGLSEVIHNGHWLPRHLISYMLCTQRQLPDTPEHDISLTAREKQILGYLTQGLSNEDISTQIHISSHTVRSHLYHIFKKIEVKNRTQACCWAKQYLATGS
jgi:LuxR family transcriptional regulator of csgAB operon